MGTHSQVTEAMRAILDFIRRCLGVTKGIKQQSDAVTGSLWLSAEKGQREDSVGGCAMALKRGGRLQ